jgi:diaminopimelate epimerase
MYRWMGEACGNTFLVLFCWSKQSKEVVLYLNNLRRLGRWNFDSVLALSPSQSDQVRMRVLERDGTESNMCGNGLRVVGCVLDELGLPRVVVVRAGVISIERTRQNAYAVPVKVKRLGAKLLSSNDPVFTFYSVSGEPHAVAVVPDVNCAVLKRWGAKFTPYANCTVVSREGKDRLLARTFERGVNNITESCGTGACAAAHAVNDLFEAQGRCYEVQMHDHVLHVSVGTEITLLEGQAQVRKRDEI